jgi:hypothetical protein
MSTAVGRSVGDGHGPDTIREGAERWAVRAWTVHMTKRRREGRAGSGSETVLRQLRVLDSEATHRAHFTIPSECR